MAPGVSVIICCYNSAERLPETLQHLALQQVPNNIPWEVIIVDNASKDHTAKIAAEIWYSFDTPQIAFKVLYQPIQGKNYAYEKGVTEARFEYILTCDDDNHLFNNYIATAFEIMQSDPKIGVLGGCGVFDPEQPAWSDIEKFSSYYVNGSQQDATTRHWVYGAGSICRKSVLVDLYKKGWQQITSGRAGSKLICGEDVEICFIYFLYGYKIIANEKLIFKHFVPAKRQNIEYIINMNYWLSYTNVLLNSYYSIIYNDRMSFEKKIKDWYFATTKALIKQEILLLYKRLMSLAALSIDEKISFQSTLGTFISLYKNKEKIIKHHYHIKSLIAD